MWPAGGGGPNTGWGCNFRPGPQKGVKTRPTPTLYKGNRHYKILDEHLAKSRYMVGDIYSIVDMACWGWARLAAFVLGDEAYAKYPNVKRLVDEITARPAAARAIALKDKFTFKTEMDEEAKNFMFGHLKTKAA